VARVTDPETLPQNSTWYLMTKIPGVKYKDIGNFMGTETGLSTDSNKVKMNWDGLISDNLFSDSQMVGNSNERLSHHGHSQVLNNTVAPCVNQSTDPIVAKFKQHDCGTRVRVGRISQQFTPSHSTFCLL